MREQRQAATKKKTARLGRMPRASTELKRGQQSARNATAASE